MIIEGIELRDIPGYEDIYSINNDGTKLWSHARWWGGNVKGAHFREGSWLKLNLGSSGYYRVDLCKDTKNIPHNVHVLVCLVWVSPRPFPKAQVRHYPDPTRTNNHHTNLRWGTQKENAEDMVRDGKSPKGIRNPNAVLNEEKVQDIRQRLLCGETRTSIATIYDVNYSTIERIDKGLIWVT